MRSPRYVVISTDGHCGADVLDYKPYLERRFYDQFDAWAATYHDAWGDLDEGRPPENRIGVASFDAPLNWDGPARIAHMESQGIVAEALFPNTSPPFYPSGAISAPGPRTAEELVLRWAGVRAHNRWLAEFCAEAPGRRAGLAQIFLDDVQQAIDEVRWAKSAGLMGILLPSDHVLKLVNLYYPAYEPLWAVCAELGLPVHRHGVKPTEAPSEGGNGSLWIGGLESGFYHTRPIAHLICSGVFERHPDLKFVVTEAVNAIDIPGILQRLDRMYEESRRGDTARVVDISAATSQLRRRPSEYFATNCFVGGALDFRVADGSGVPNMMWGADLPHAEGSSPYTREVLRLLFAGMPENDVRDRLGLTAARLYGFDLEQLQTVAERVGPSVEEVATPLLDSERPQFPADTRCLAFQSR